MLNVNTRTLFFALRNLCDITEMPVLLAHPGPPNNPMYDPVPLEQHCLITCFCSGRSVILMCVEVSLVVIFFVFNNS